VRQKNGFTMVELLIAMAISSFVMAAVYAIHRSQQKAYVAQDQAATMQQNLRGGMYFLQKGIRMAGSDPNDNVGATVSAAGSNSMSFTRQYTEDFRDQDNSGDQNGAEPFLDYNGNGNWDSGAAFTIQYFLVDSDGDGVNDTLATNGGGANLWIAENIQAVGFAYAFDKSPLDGELDMAGGNTIWAIDTDGNGTLDLNLDSNLDGNIDAADDTDGDGTTIDGAAIGGPTVNLADIRSVRIWLLARANREDDSFYNDTRYVLADRIITPNDSVRRELMIMDVKCRNMGL